MMLAAVMLRGTDCIEGSAWSAIPQPTGWQRIADEIKAAFIFAGAYFVNVQRCYFISLCHCRVETKRGQRLGCIALLGPSFDSGKGRIKWLAPFEPQCCNDNLAHRCSEREI
jgi:hypothetical protein